MLVFYEFSQETNIVVSEQTEPIQAPFVVRAGYSQRRSQESYIAWHSPA